jgi:3-deoxy-D-manno-octulosonic-acid transferase
LKTKLKKYFWKKDLVKLIYDFFIILAYIICQPLRLISTKVNLFYKGRAKSFEIIVKEINPNEKNIWFHVSSLGEFEIAKPMIESLKKRFDNLKIIVTFFSPSGYENSKKYKYADSKVYLPLDNSYNAKRFVRIVNPRIAIFIKNDIWSNYLNYLKKNGL